MNLKDELRRKDAQIDSLRFQIKLLNDFKEENIRLKRGYENSNKFINQISKEKDAIENNVSLVLSSFKTLVGKKGSEYAKIKSQYNNDLLERMKKDNKYFEEKLSVIEKISSNMLDELYSKVKQYFSALSSGSSSQDNLAFDINSIKYNLQNILNEFNFVFKEIKNILKLSSSYIEEEDEETVKNLQIIDIIVDEVDRLLQFVPNEQLIRNNVLGQLGINPNNYPLNTPTIRIILMNMIETKRKRQTQLRSILDEIKNKSKKVLTKKKDLENEIKNAMGILNNEQKKNNSRNSGEGIDLESIFADANNNNLTNIKDFGNEVVSKLQKDINSFTEKLEEEAKQIEKILDKVKTDFMNKWGKMKTNACDSIADYVKNGSEIYFEKYMQNYYKFEKITDVLKKKFFSPECEIIKFGLLHCDKTIEKVKKDIEPCKCVITLGNNNNGYFENLKDYLVKNLPYIIYQTEDYSINSFAYNVEYNIKKITSNEVFEVIFPILLIHFNDYTEFEKEINYIKQLIINCLRKKVSFLFFFNKKNSKDIDSINKKINEFIEKASDIKSTIKDTKFPISQTLACNMTSVEFCLRNGMEQLTNFKKDIKCKIDKNELKNEYFEKMFDVFNTHTISNDLLNIKSGQHELDCRHRLLDSIMNYSILCLNLDKKPKTRQLKEKEEITLNEQVQAVLDDIYNNNLLKDYNTFMNDLLQKKAFELYLNREKLMADLDIQYNTSLLIEENEPEKTKKEIYKEIETIIDKKYKKEALKFIGRFVWSSFFDRYCPKYYILMEKEFEVPEDFDQYLIDSFNVEEKK